MRFASDINPCPRSLHRQGEPAESLYIIISGRLRLLHMRHAAASPVRRRNAPEEDVGRGESVGAVWALSGGAHDSTALCVRDTELVRMSKVRDWHRNVQMAYAFFLSARARGAAPVCLKVTCKLGSCSF